MKRFLIIVVLIVAFGAVSAHAKPPTTPLPMNAKRLVGHLKRAVKANNAKRIERIVRVIVVLGSRAKLVLKQQLRNTNSAIFPHMLDAVSRMSPRYRLLARPLLRSTDKRIRKMAAAALRGADPKVVIAAYQAEPELDIRLTLLESLAESEGEEVAPFLCECLTNASATVRAHGLQALRIHGSRTVLAEVYGALRDANSKVRGEAIATVGSIGSRQSVSVLLDLYTIEADKENKAAIARALRELTGQNYGHDIKAWNRWISSGS